MENIELKKIKINKVVSNLQMLESGINLVFDDGSMLQMIDNHEQDCCEHVYADWSILEYQKKDIIGLRVDELVIKTVVGEGLLLCFSDNIKCFIGCYNEQNGYYSDDLELVIQYDGNISEIDISEFVYDNID